MNEEITVLSVDQFAERMKKLLTARNADESCIELCENAIVDTHALGYRIRY